MDPRLTVCHHILHPIPLNESELGTGHMRFEFSSEYLMGKVGRFDIICQKVCPSKARDENTIHQETAVLPIRIKNSG